MARKRIRNLESSNDSNDTTTTETKMGTCPHIGKGIDISLVKKSWKKKEEVACQLCKQRTPVNKRVTSSEQDLWICLRCGNVGCGHSRSNHVQDHYETPRSDCHAVVAQIDSWTVRCLNCKNEINVNVNVKALDALEFLKRNCNFLKEEKQEIEDVPVSGDTQEKQTKPLYSHDKKSSLTSHMKSHPLPVLGLENLGNTCYFNAVLQSLAQTPGFVSELESRSQSSWKFALKGGDNLVCKEYGGYLPPLEGKLGEAGQLTKAVLKLMKRVKDGQHLRQSGVPNESPADVLRLMKRYSNTFYIGEQHDSHELLRLLLEGLRTEDLKRYQRGILNSLGINPNSVEVTEVEREHFIAYKKQAMENEFTVDRIFGGSLVSILKCVECGEVTTTFESFMDISLPVESEKPRPFQSQRWDKGNLEEYKERPSKHQLKKERKMARRGRRKNKGGKNVPEPNSSALDASKVHSSSDSASDSEADVEDNLDSETTVSSVIISDMNKSESDKTIESCDYAGDLSFVDTSSSEKQDLSMNLLSISKEAIYSSTPENVPIISGSSPDQSLVLQTSEPSEIIYNYSPEASLMEDFGSCEGGRGSPASSITQADWDEESNSRSDITVHLKSMIKDLQLSDDSCPPPAPFELSEEDYVKAVPWTDTIKDVSSDSQISRLCSTEEVDQSLEKAMDQHPINGNKTVLKIDEQEVTKNHSDIGSNKKDLEDTSLNNSVLVDVGDVELDNLDWGATLTPPVDVEDKVYSAYKCLNHFFSKETLTGANKIGCLRCTKLTNGQEPKPNAKMVHSNAHKQFLLFKLPRILTIHFKRFEVVRSRMCKIGRKINFPMILDVSSYTSSRAKVTENLAKYELYAVVEHSGHMTSGHYVAYVKVMCEEKGDKTCDIEEHRDASDTQVELKNQRNKMLSGAGDKPSFKWYLISDTHVREVTSNEVTNAEAYILFYKQMK